MIYFYTVRLKPSDAAWTSEEQSAFAAQLRAFDQERILRVAPKCARASAHEFVFCVEYAAGTQPFALEDAHHDAGIVARYKIGLGVSDEGVDPPSPD